jgi:hypothetical protein
VVGRFDDVLFDRVRGSGEVIDQSLLRQNRVTGADRLPNRSIRFQAT